MCLKEIFAIVKQIKRLLHSSEASIALYFVFFFSPHRRLTFRLRSHL